MRSKIELRIKRKKRIRGKISGTERRPRASVFKSNRHLYIQAIDDTTGRTLAAAFNAKGLVNLKTSKEIGQRFAKSLIDKKIDSIVFDRGGYKFHGNIKVLADAIREAGIKF